MNDKYSHHLLLALLNFFGQKKTNKEILKTSLKNYVKRTIPFALEDALGRQHVGGLVDATADAPLNRIMYKNLPKTSSYLIFMKFLVF